MQENEGKKESECRNRRKQGKKSARDKDKMVGCSKNV
jgi:hypothetical protein